MSDKDSSVQAKLDELNKIVGWFQGEDFKIEDAVNKYKEAEKLAKTIETDLKDLKNEIQVIKKRFDN